MHTREARLRLDLPTDADFSDVHPIGRFIAAMGGVLRARIDTKVPGILSVDFDPDATSREGILEAAAAAGIGIRGHTA